jgi:iron(III) transport system substrate-binding protein
MSLTLAKRLLCTVGWVFLLFAGCARPKERVVLYCAQDKEFAEPVLGVFTDRTGLPVDVKYDTEATKSVSLYTELVQEQNRPRCDVHWNNEILSTIRLQRQGLYEPYSSPSAEPFPERDKARDQTWTAFAARARILLVNTQLLKKADYPQSRWDLAAARWKGRVAMAKPQFGTTATEAACLFDVLGVDKAKAYYRALRANDIQIVAGNKQVAEGVAAGQFAFGVTDTDDAMEEIDAGRPVAMVFPDRNGHKDYPRMGTLFLPNTLAIVRGGPNPAGARQLVDYLLSAPVEKGLAESASHQIPLNPQVKANLPHEIERPQDAGGTVVAMDVDFEKAADRWDETQEFLRAEFAR